DRVHGLWQHHGQACSQQGAEALSGHQTESLVFLSVFFKMILIAHVRSSSLFRSPCNGYFISTRSPVAGLGSVRRLWYHCGAGLKRCTPVHSGREWPDEWLRCLLHSSISESSP